MKASAILRAQDLTRWHTISVAKQQTLADHQWAVTSLAMLLHTALIGAEPEEMAKFLIKALYHDMDEIETGDTPAPAKEFTIGEHKINADDLLISVADAIEAYHWIWNNAQGNYSETVVVSDCHRRLVRRCNAAQKHFGQELLHAVDRMLADLGLPERVF